MILILVSMSKISLTFLVTSATIKMADSITYREKRRRDSVKKFLNGEARQPYVLREDISRGLKDQRNNCLGGESSSSNASPCTCQAVLGKFAGTFKSMRSTGRKLVNRASIQQPKTANKKYRDINQQNKWLLENVFDPYGNYVFCFHCIKNILEVSGNRLHRLREIKRQQAAAPTIKVRVDQISAEQTCDVIPPETVTNVLVWWANLEDSSIIELHTAEKLHHGKSNKHKEDLLVRFLEFIDHNSQPNGRRVGSHGPLFFLSSKFDRINAPSANDADKPEQWKKRSLVYEYNNTLEHGKSISNGTAKKWLKIHRPKHAIGPKKTDYCETCVECQEQRRRHETISMRLQPEGNGNEDKIRENTALAESYALLLEEHKMDAANELEHYRQQTAKNRSLYYRIEELHKKESKSKEEKMRRQKLMSLSCVYTFFRLSAIKTHTALGLFPSTSLHILSTKTVT